MIIKIKKKVKIISMKQKCGMKFLYKMENGKIK
jgi:hypothetical protein